MADSSTGPRLIKVITDQKDADGSYHGAVAEREEDGTLVIQQDGTAVAWYAPGQWIKVEFS